MLQVRFWKFVGTFPSLLSVLVVFSFFLFSLALVVWSGALETAFLSVSFVLGLSSRTGPIPFSATSVDLSQARAEGPTNPEGKGTIFFNIHGGSHDRGTYHQVHLSDDMWVARGSEFRRKVVKVVKSGSCLVSCHDLGLRLSPQPLDWQADQEFHIFISSFRWGHHLVYCG